MDCLYLKGEYMSYLNRQPTKPTLMLLKIIWGALLFSQVLYTFALFRFAGQNESASVPNPDLVPVLGSVAAFMLLMSIFWPRKPHFMTPFILRLAMLESVAVLGFALAFLSSDASLFLPFVSVSVAGFFINFPAAEKVKALFA
jgi:hypothetical protein